MKDSRVPATRPLPEIALSPLLQGNEAPVIHALLSSTHHGILMTYHDGTDVLCNARFGEIFGLDPELVVHSTREDVRKMALERVKDPDEFNALIASIYADPTLVHEDEIELATDPPRILRRYTGPVIGGDGSNLGRLWTFDDITEMRHLEEVSRLHAALQKAYDDLNAAQEGMVESAKLGAVGTLAVSIAHDIRNILTPLKLELAMAPPDSTLDATRPHFDRLSALAHRLLALSHPAELKHVPVEVPHVVEGVRPLLEHQAEVDRITICTKWPEDLPPVLGDRSRLEHLFINLMLNGLNAMSSRGGTLRVFAAREGEGVRIDVADEGIGIAPENLERIFDPFFTTRKNGSGLGLFSVRRIAEEHDGCVTVRSTPGEGTCFSVWLPEYRECREAT